MRTQAHTTVIFAHMRAKCRHTQKIKKSEAQLWMSLLFIFITRRVQCLDQLVSHFNESHGPPWCPHPRHAHLEREPVCVFVCLYVYVYLCENGTDGRCVFVFVCVYVLLVCVWACVCWGCIFSWSIISVGLTTKHSATKGAITPSTFSTTVKCAGISHLLPPTNPKCPILDDPGTSYFIELPFSMSILSV